MILLIVTSFQLPLARGGSPNTLEVFIPGNIRVFDGKPIFSSSASPFFLTVFKDPVGQNHRPPGVGKPEVHRLHDRVVAVTGLYHTAGGDFGVNAGVIFTPGHILFIDSGMTVASAEFLWGLAAERWTGREKLHLVLTHYHSDHTFGMAVIKGRGAEVIAHTLSTEHLRDDHGEYKQFIIRRAGWDQKRGDEILGDVRLSTPDQLVDKDTVLTFDGEEIHLLAVPGHTADGLCVYHPASKTLFAGDAVYEGAEPTTRFGGPPEWRTWVSQLERLKKLDLGTVVPGHGRLCGRSEIDRNISFLLRRLDNRRGQEPDKAQ